MARKPRAHLPAGVYQVILCGNDGQATFHSGEDRQRFEGLVAEGRRFRHRIHASCGLATNLWQLAMARIGVSVGEAGTNPASHSLIADLYPISARCTAMATFALGPHVGLVLGFVLGGIE
jgi:hypothetical protein